MTHKSVHAFEPGLRKSLFSVQEVEILRHFLEQILGQFADRFFRALGVTPSTTASAGLCLEDSVLESVGVIEIFGDVSIFVEAEHLGHLEGGHCVGHKSDERLVVAVQRVFVDAGGGQGLVIVEHLRVVLGAQNSHDQASVHAVSHSAALVALPCELHQGWEGNVLKFVDLHL